MTDVLLHDREQAAVRALIASESVPGGNLPGEVALEHLSRLIRCDAIGIAVVDSMGSVPGQRAVLVGSDGDAMTSEAAVVGIQQIDHATAGAGGRGVAVLTFGVRNGHHHVVQIWMLRRTRGFTERDRALLRLVAPALERLLRARPTSTLPPSLTPQERRVLLHVAEGLSTTEIADRLVVAPSTVSKHLENAYRKLGVTNRLAAVHVLQDSRDAT